jgi:two-component system NarL family sensor kinase
VGDLGVDVVSRAVDRMLYGARGDPYAVLSVLSRRLAATTDPRPVLGALAQGAAETVLSPYVLAEAAGGLLRVERGTAQPVAIRIPLRVALAHPGGTPGARAPGRPGSPGTGPAGRSADAGRGTDGSKEVR